MSETPAQRQRPTIRDVAALSGASLKTVSRVVNGEVGVSPDLARRVRTAISQLGYRHNLSASNLRRSGGKTALVGLLLSNVVNQFDAAVHRAIEDVARMRGVAVLAASVDESAERERELVAAFSSRQVDGLIVMPASHDQSYLIDERRTGTAIVFLDRPPAFFDADAILVDNHAGAVDATKHLLDHGHRRIGYLGDLRSITTAADRYRGYCDALVAASIPPDDDSLVRLDLHDSDIAQRATLELFAMDDPPTALFSGQNLVTIGAIRALRELGMQHDIALIGFDEIALGDLLEPAVTVIAQDAEAIGAKAAATLFARIDGDRGPTRKYLIPTTLVARGSGEIRH